MNWIKANDLESWANTLNARGQLPQIIRSLCFATLDKITHIDFPAYESVQRPGFDGTLSVEEENAFAPAGLSVWEMGTNKKITSKANGDYKNRIDEDFDFDKKQTTFIFITPRRWSTKAKWAKEKDDQKIWKKVITYDGNDLEHWLETAPAVAIRLAEIVGIKPKHALSLEKYWEEWSTLKDFTISPELLLSGRNEDVCKIQEWLENKNDKELLVQAEKKNEAIAFLYATIFRYVHEDDKKEIKAIVVENEESLRQLLLFNRHPLLLVNCTNNIEISIQPDSIHKLFTPIDRSNTVNKGQHKLSHPVRKFFIEELTKLKKNDNPITEEEASRMSKETGRYFSVFRWYYSGKKNQPEWLANEFVQYMIIAFFIGRWSEGNGGDEEVIRKFITPKEFHVKMKMLLNSSDQPVINIDHFWRIISPEYIFWGIAKHITREQLNTYKQILLTVISEKEPSLELPVDQRWLASFHGKIRKYSTELRRGLLEALIMIAVNGEATKLSLTSPQGWVDNIVSSIFETYAKDNDWQSLTGDFVLLAEASPLIFLNSLEAELSKEKPSIGILFEKTDNSLTSPSYFTRLVWAL